MAGSSPLARGLPCFPSQWFYRFRIIPARAGFTRLFLLLLLLFRDHPRSRGVYSTPVIRSLFSVGSSPLARGLPLTVLPAAFTTGIIPARAGFTPRAIGLPKITTDHPRSRGVYGRGVFEDGLAVGSSPLARGLRLFPRVSGRGRRIIPARAGFTIRDKDYLTGSADHPRSRGVYLRIVGVATEGGGIIPARAGFTDNNMTKVIATGIIPARAGFTSRVASIFEDPRDHPRSRGVYYKSVVKNCGGQGSSPLARGLLRGTDRLVADEGIIPARAGFTPALDCPLS